jgi:branched-chain amino acid transport system permease protein
MGNLRLFGRTVQWWQVLSVAILAVLPLLITSQYLLHLLILVFIYAIVATNWDLTLGYAGLFNWAHTAFFALGAYTAGILSKTFGLNPWIGFAAAVVVAVLAAIVVATPVLRVKGIYLVLVTFAFSQLCLHFVVGMSDISGGTQGLVLIPTLAIGTFSFARDGKVAYYFLALLLLLASTIYLRRLVTSGFGLSIQALRNNEQYAVSRGVPVARQRLLTFAASAAFTGAAGAFLTYYVGVVSPELFGFRYVVLLLSMILLGGVGTIYGPIIGAFVLTFISEALVDLGPWSQVIIATIIVAVLLFYPEGIIAALRRVRFRKPVTSTSLETR